MQSIRHSQDWNLAVEAAIKICIDRKNEYLKNVRLHSQLDDFYNRMQECAGEAENIAKEISKLFDV